MAIIDTLKGILGDDAIAKIEAAGLTAKLNRGDELVTYLDNGEIPPEAKTAPSGVSLEDLTKTLNNSFAEFETKFTPKINEIVDARSKAMLESEGLKFRGEVLGTAIRLAHKTTKVESEHKALFNEDLDLDKLDEFMKESAKEGRSYADPEAAWKDWTRERRTEIEIERRSDEKAKTKTSSEAVPGVTPGAATGLRAALKTFGKAVNADGKTRSEVLNDKLAQLERAG